MVAIRAAEGAGPGQDVVQVAGGVPGCEGFHPVVGDAQGVQVAGTGGAALIPRDVVVVVAANGGLAAPGEAAALVAGLHPVCGGGRDSVGGATEVQDGAAVEAAAVASAIVCWLA